MNFPRFFSCTYKEMLFVPFFSLLFFLLFASVPLFVKFDIFRIRIEGASLRISEIVKKDIFSRIQLEDTGINLTGRFSFVDMLGFFSLLHSACQKSIWTVLCHVDFRFPDLVLIEFEAVKPIGFLAENGYVFLVSDNGDKLSEPISISKIYELKLNYLPFIKIESSRCNIKDIISQIKTLAEKINPDQIVCLDFSLEVYLRDGYKAVFPRDNFENAFHRFVKFLDELSDRSISEIDMRGDGKIFVK